MRVREVIESCRTRQRGDMQSRGLAVFFYFVGDGSVAWKRGAGALDACGRSHTRFWHD